MKKLILVIFFIILAAFRPASSSYQIALLKYSGGGDWYCNPTSLPNLARFCNQNLGTNINEDIATVEVGSPQIFDYPFVHMTGHGNIVFSKDEVTNLRNYLVSGGFLHICDSYGMDKFARREMKKVFPELDFVELPISHEIYHQKYDFPHGIPKIHEHDGLPAQGFGLIYEGRLVCFYDYQCDLGDGWEDKEVHHDSDSIRLLALKMGANMIQYVFKQ